MPAVKTSHTGTPTDPDKACALVQRRYLPLSGRHLGLAHRRPTPQC